MTAQSTYSSVTQIGDNEHHNSSSRNALLEEFRFGARARMLLFFIGAVAAALGQHFFYSFLNGRSAESSPIDSLLESLPFSISDQSLVNFIGNLMAQAGSACLSAAIGTAFAQLFWQNLKERTQGLKVRNVNDIQGFSPVNPLTWGAIRHAPLLAAVAVCGALMAFISTFTPGSLTVKSISVDRPCGVPTADLSHAMLTAEENLNETTGLYTYTNPTGRVYSFVTRVMMAGEYFPPGTSPCGLCTYNISFAAPALQCANITQAVNFTELLPPADWTWVWKAQYEGGAYLEIASRNIEGTPTNLTANVDLPVIALNCTAYNATYHVAVEHNVTTTLTINQVDMGQQLIVADPWLVTADLYSHQLLAVWDAFARQLGLNGGVQYVYDYNEFTHNSTWVAWSLLGDGSDVGIAWQWPGDLQDIIPQFMQNISLSLLTGQLSSAGASSTSLQDT